MPSQRSLGADDVIDDGKDDFTQNGHQYDVILDAAAHRSLADHQRALAPKGVYIHLGGSGGRYRDVMPMGPRRSKWSGQRCSTYLKRPTQQNLTFVKELLEVGTVAPGIDNRYSVGEVPDAIR